MEFLKNFFIEKNNKGALTLEAAIALPIFLFILLSIIMFSQVIYIQNEVKKAVNLSSIELSRLPYLYYKLKGMEENRSLSLLRTYLTIHGDNGNVDTNARNLLELITYSFENNENTVNIIDFYFNRNLNPKVFKKNNLGAYITSSGSGSLKMFDFEGSEIFSDQRSIYINIKYKIELILPIKLIPVLNMSHATLLRCWADGDGSINEEEYLKLYSGNNVWEMSPIPREIILKNMLSQKEPYKNYVNKQSFLVMGIDLNAHHNNDYYNLKNRIIRRIYSYKNEQSLNTDLYNEIIIIYPSGSLTVDAKTMMEDISTYFGGKGINVKYLEFYQIL
jgi:hypothetical protein